MSTKSTRQIIEESNRIGVQFLLADTSAGHTFLDVADTSGSRETQERNRQLALTAYKTVLRLTPKVTPLEHEARELQRQLGELRDRLISLGLLADSEAFGPSAA